MDVGDAVVVQGGVGQNADHPSSLNISDVFEAISIADPSFGAGASVVDSMARQPASTPFARIIEQPAGKSLRFRYECEGRSAGSIPGVSSTPENRTYPTIKVYNYIGRVIIVVSCVTKDEPFRPHPHNLVGRDRCERGVCTIKTEITEDNSEYQFKNLGIQCVKRRDVADALRVREEIKVDPFRTGFSHRSQPQGIDLNAVRLCFQVFLLNEAGKIRYSLPPAVSDIIYDKKAMSDLQIMRASHCSGPARGGTQLILLCEKVTREDTAVVFYQEEGQQVVWEEPAVVSLVHKTYAIAFQTPPYRQPNTTQHVNVMFQLKRISDNARSNSLPFEYIPEFTDSDYFRNKRRKTLIPSIFHEQDRMFQMEQKPIKSEPRDKTPPHHMSSPPLQVYTPQYDQNWGMPVDVATGLGPSGLNPYAAEMAWSAHNYAQQLSPNVQTLSPSLQNLSPSHAMTPNVQQSISPNMQAMSPNMQAMSPNMQSMSPNMQAMSPNMQAMSPNMQVMSPNVQALSPMRQTLSPNVQATSPAHGGVSPHPMGHISPNLVQQQVYNQQMAQAQHVTQQPMEEQYTPSLSSLLLEREGQLLPSGELSLSSLLADRNPDLSDSLNRLSTSDLQNYLN